MVAVFLFDELKDVPHKRGKKLEGAFSDYYFTIEGGGEPQMESVVCHAGK
jgi:hypothetical protein